MVCVSFSTSLSHTMFPPISTLKKFLDMCVIEVKALSLFNMTRDNLLNCPLSCSWNAWPVDQLPL